MDDLNNNLNHKKKIFFSTQSKILQSLVMKSLSFTWHVELDQNYSENSDFNWPVKNTCLKMLKLFVKMWNIINKINVNLINSKSRNFFKFKFIFHNKLINFIIKIK